METPIEGSQGTELLWQGRNISCTHRAQTGSCHPPPKCCLSSDSKVRSPSRVLYPASSDFTKEQRNDLNQSVNTWFGIFGSMGFFLKAGFVYKQ